MGDDSIEIMSATDDNVSFSEEWKEIPAKLGLLVKRNCRSKRLTCWQSDMENSPDSAL